MRDPMTGEDITDDPERWIDWREDPMLGRWTRTAPVIGNKIRSLPAEPRVQDALMASFDEDETAEETQ